MVVVVFMNKSKRGRGSPDLMWTVTTCVVTVWTTCQVVSTPSKRILMLAWQVVAVRCRPWVVAVVERLRDVVVVGTVMLWRGVVAVDGGG